MQVVDIETSIIYKKTIKETKINDAIKWEEKSPDHTFALKAEISQFSVLVVGSYRKFLSETSTDNVYAVILKMTGHWLKYFGSVEASLISNNSPKIFEDKLVAIPKENEKARE
jgi:hypothetical protein